MEEARNGQPPDTPARSSAKDVARLAGVSTATVSRALNLPDRVDPQTRVRVRQAIDKLRYVPHGVASALRSQRTRMIGAVVPSFDYALYARTTSALQRVLDERGYSLVLASHHYDAANEVRVTEQLIRHGVDAFAFVGTDHDNALYRLLDDYGRPYVLTWGVDASRQHPSIGFDNAAATREVTRHLLDLGHRRFGLLSAPTTGNDRARERGAGVREALQAMGLALDARYVRYGQISLESGAAGMRALLKLKPRPTAVIATNDVFAVGAMIACREARVRIPDDISMTGVDSTDLGATQTPALTSVRTPVIEVGDAAARQLVARLEGLPAELHQQMPFELVVRGSTAPPLKRARAA
ncbi:MAG TPA: LacI family DNA-binding transcriptional regulator [Casimicrobiaceae bacterium]|nr:LacI family DNA-binding transcriptional regulator [Casimicrobiaceae bacterium]